MRGCGGECKDAGTPLAVAATCEHEVSLLQRADVEPRGRAADPGQVTQDPVHFQRIGDDGEDFNLVAAVRADKGIFAIDLSR